jgi:tetratricopeptide (TPR) repeat protein
LEKVIGELAAQKPQQASDWYFNYASRILPVHLADLRGSLLSLQGNAGEAERTLLEAAEKEKSLGYWEPPHYTRPVLESLGAVYLRAGKFDESRAAFEKTLKARPNSGFAYLAIARTYVKAGDKAKAAEFYRQFLRAWERADSDLQTIAEAKSWLKNNM